MNAATPAIVQLTAAGVAFSVHEFEHDPTTRNFGHVAAMALGVDPDRVFKTLLVSVTVGPNEIERVVGIVPVPAKLSLKELASVVGGKRAEMCDPADAQRITGYVVGGISPFGQKRRLTTVIDETAELSATIFVSGGRRGLDIEIAPADLVTVLAASVASIATW